MELALEGRHYPGFVVVQPVADGALRFSAAPGQFLLKDLVLQAASLSLLFASVQGPWLNVQKS
jgi:hypothetical protein